MIRSIRNRPVRIGVIFVMAAAAVFGLTFGAAFASGSGGSSSLPCNGGGPSCINIGFSDAWLNGHTVQLEYSHPFFCAEPPESAASSHCEAGAPAKVAPPSGPVVSELYVLVPVGFRAPATTLHCGFRCIDQPGTIDLTRVLHSAGGNVVIPPRSFVIEENESFQSTWWPMVLVGVKNLHAWNKIAAAKSIDAVDACQENGGCFQEQETNAFIFFQVLGPGMHPGGPD